MKNNRKIYKKQKPFMTLAKITLIALTAVYPLFMTIMTGIGILSKSSSYGRMISGCGAVLIISGAAMTTAAILCLFRKSFPNLISMIMSVTGFVLCMAALHKLIRHAESAGWMGHGVYSLVPVADMYRQRIIPVILPFLLTLIIAAVQFFSYNVAEERREKRLEKKKKQNSPPAPKIIDS